LNTKTENIPRLTIVKCSTIQNTPQAESAINVAEKNIINSQIEWMSQNLISTDVIGDATYLNFIQNLVNYGADHGKKDVTNFLNREIITHDVIPKKCIQIQNELKSDLKDTEFTISYSTWENFQNENYVTVFVYYFTQDFEYKIEVLGTRKCSDYEDEMANLVREIVMPYRSNNGEIIKCVSDEPCGDFETYPCIISRISKIIMKSINASDENKNFFNKIYTKAHDVMATKVKNPFASICDEEKMKFFFSFHQFVKDNEVIANALIKTFMSLLGTLFSAIMNLIETTEAGNHCVTANKVYLWYKKLLKFYSEFTCDDKIANGIATLILKLIKESFNNKIHDLYQIAVFLNPNFKSLKFLTLSERNVLLDIVKKNLEKLMSDEDTDAEHLPPSKKQKTAASKNQTHLSDTFAEFMDCTMESVDDQVNSEIQRYMGYKLDNPVDIIEFWASNDSFPYMKKLAKNYLNLPSCTFYNNCCFLSDGHEFYQKCKNLHADDIENLTFLHRNL
jgi:hypothetical protein